MYNYYIETKAGKIYQVESGGKDSCIEFGKDYSQIYTSVALNEYNIVQMINNGLKAMREIDDMKQFDEFYFTLCGFDKFKTIPYANTRKFWKEEV